ncbi:MAG TPA: polysaccharide deacetylase family protein [Abditibacteriaceae bacterium]
MKTPFVRHSALRARRPAFFFSASALGLVAALCNIGCRSQTESAAEASLPQPTPQLKPTATPRPRKIAQQELLSRWARGKTVSEVHLKPGVRAIALTFDDGPWPHYTQQILDILEQEKVPATFFFVGRNVQNYPKIARRVRDGGHTIANHTWNHLSRPRKGAKAEIDRTDAIIRKELGVKVTLFRPPYGIVRNGLADVAKKQGKTVVLWSSDSMDWSRASAFTIHSRVHRQGKPGGIVLMHDGGGPRRATVEALPYIISSLRGRGFRFVTVPQLLAMHVPPVKKVRVKKTPVKKVQHAKLQQPSMPAKKPVAAKPHLPQPIATPRPIPPPTPR